MWRDWFTFTKGERRAILLLTLLIIGVMIWLYRPTSTMKEATLFANTDSVATLMQKRNIEPTEAPRHTKSTNIQHPNGHQPHKEWRETHSPHKFNPNTADSLELLSIGLTPQVARNILHYRKAGGHFRRPEDLARIYGLHDTTFNAIKPYIDIPKEKLIGKESKGKRQNTSYNEVGKSNHNTQNSISTYNIKENTSFPTKHAKLKPGQFVDINIADTTELMKIPGIGPIYAKMIVDYRQLLGGYCHVAQLHELTVLPEDIGDWVHISSTLVKKLKINHLSITQLRTHPYLTFYQAKAIVELRKREGDIKSARQLLFLDEFSEKDITRLTPYLTFE